MSGYNDSEPAENLEGALRAVLEVSRQPGMLSEYRTVSQAFDEDDYRTLVALAWRYQFDESRSRFRRELRAFQQHMAPKVKALLEGGDR